MESSKIHELFSMLMDNENGSQLETMICDCISRIISNSTYYSFRNTKDGDTRSTAFNIYRFIVAQYTDDDILATSPIDANDIKWMLIANSSDFAGECITRLRSNPILDDNIYQLTIALLFRYRCTMLDASKEFEMQQLAFLFDKIRSRYSPAKTCEIIVSIVEIFALYQSL